LHLVDSKGNSFVDFLGWIRYNSSMKTIIERLKVDFERRKNYRRLSYNEKRIKDAEVEMYHSYARWQSLIAANDASIKAKEEITGLVQDTYTKFGMTNFNG